MSQTQGHIHSYSKQKWKNAKNTTFFRRQFWRTLSGPTKKCNFFPEAQESEVSKNGPDYPPTPPQSNPQGGSPDANLTGQTVCTLEMCKLESTVRLKTICPF